MRNVRIPIIRLPMYIGFKNCGIMKHAQSKTIEMSCPLLATRIKTTVVNETELVWLIVPEIVVGNFLYIFFVILCFSSSRAVIMRLYWPLLFCFVRLTGTENNSANIITPHILNGHYINWPSKKIEEKFIKEKRFVPRHIIYTRFQVCSEIIYLIAPRYK